ncbi:Nif3-like dinuclear metal center hexameric protein [bacterium]|nr:Nif3-like dinuclear metal center hexameric protein [bacterium]
MVTPHTPITDVVAALNRIAPESLSEDFDNPGLLLGDPNSAVQGVLCCLEIDDAVLDEAVQLGCNLIVAHHPLIFKPLKRLDPRKTPDRWVLRCIREDIAVYAFHTAYDKVDTGVSRILAESLGLVDLAILQPVRGGLMRLDYAVPESAHQACLEALFSAGFGRIGNYANCSYSAEGTGTFTPLAGAQPALGHIGVAEVVFERKVSLLIEAEQFESALRVLRRAHPYETVAYEGIPLRNSAEHRGLGMIGSLPEPLNTTEFLDRVLVSLGCDGLRFGIGRKEPVQRVAVCGGSGAFLIAEALRAGADAYVTADLKHHDFQEGEGMLLVDAGHAQTEEPAMRKLSEKLRDLFPNFAVLLASRSTDPIRFRLNPRIDVHDQRVSHQRTDR